MGAGANMAKGLNMTLDVIPTHIAWVITSGALARALHECRIDAEWHHDEGRARRWRYVGRYMLERGISTAATALARPVRPCRRCGYRYGADWLDGGEACPVCKLV